MSEQLVKPRDSIVTGKTQRRLVSFREASEYLSTGRNTLRRLVHDGKLAVVLLGTGAENGSWRFDMRDLDALIERNKQSL